MIDREQPDFVDVITPPETHAEICDHAASRGVAIVCQKPLAPSLEESASIVERAKLAGVRFMVHENFRWQPVVSRSQAGLVARASLGIQRTCTSACAPAMAGDRDAYLARQPFLQGLSETFGLRDCRSLHRHLPLLTGRG